MAGIAGRNWAPTLPGVSGAGSELYTADYYAKYLADGSAYERNEYWLSFFGRIADRLVQDVQPRTALDAGCAFGFLVEALRDRGVEAYGIDISEYAISQVREDIRPYCRVGSVTADFDRDYDLITCVEVIEHLQPADADIAVANLCRHAGAVLFSSTAEDYREPTHFAVRAPEQWAESFARHGFRRDLDHEAWTYLTPWAALFRRSEATTPATVLAYERVVWRLRQENIALRSALVQHEQQLEQAKRERDALEVKVEALEKHVTAMESTRAWRTAEALRRLKPGRGR